MLPLEQNGYLESEVLDQLRGKRGPVVPTYRYDLLDHDNLYLRTLTDDAVLSGSVSQNYLADIKRTARFTMIGDPTIDYLSDRIMPWVRVAMPGPPPAGPQDYAEHVEALSPLLWYKLDEAPGATVAVNSAVSGSAFNGTVSSSAMPGQSGLIDGQSYNFTAAASGRVEVASNALAGLDELTVCGWCKASAVGHDRVLLSAVPAATGGPSYVELRFDAAGSIGAAVNCLRGSVTMEGGTTAAAETIASVASTDTMFVAMTWRSGDGVVIYANGAEVAVSGTSNSSTTGVVASAADTTLLGSSGVAGSYWDGRLDDMSVYNVALTADQLQALYRSGLKEGPYSDRRYVEWPQGVFLLSTPGKAIDATRIVTREIEAYDQLQVLADDKVTNRTTATSGDLYTTTIAGLLSGITYNITPSAKTLPASRDWEPGTPKLAIINDLLDAINYEPLFFDEYGTAVARPYVAPASRASEFTYRDDADSVQLPDARELVDLFGVANKWVLVVSDADRAALTSTVTNDDPASATSTINRGRTITDFRTEQDAADQATLDALATRLAQEASQVFATVEFETGPMPFHSHSDVLTFAHDGLVSEAKFHEVSWELPLVAGATMRHAVRRVVELEVS